MPNIALMSYLMIFFTTEEKGFWFRWVFTLVTDANNKHTSHPNVLKLQRNRNHEHSFSFHLADAQQVSFALKLINSRKVTGYEKLSEKTIHIAY